MKLSRNVGVRLHIGATSYSRTMHYVVSKRREMFSYWRNVIFQNNALRCLETSGSYYLLTQRHVPEAFNPQLKTSELALFNLPDVSCQTSVPICQATRRRISRAPNFTKKCGDSCRRQNLVPPTDWYTFPRYSAALILQLSSTVKRIIDFIAEWRVADDTVRWRLYNVPSFDQLTGITVIC